MSRDPSMKPDQERLSEQAREIAESISDGSLTITRWTKEDEYHEHGDDDPETAEFIASLARQLTEAERETRTERDLRELAERERDKAQDRRREDNEDALRYLAALDRIAPMQQEALAKIEANGFVFDDIGTEPGNWQHLAFTLYTDLCEVDSIVSAALDTADVQMSPPKSSSAEALDTGGSEG